MRLLGDIAQNVMDLYYQDNKSDDDFFRPYHFLYMCSLAYQLLLQTEFNNSRRVSQEEESGQPIGFVSDDWFVPESVTFTRAGNGTDFTCTLKYPVFNFQYDTQNSGLKEIFFEDCGKNNTFVKVPVEAKWEIKHYPAVDDVIFGYPVGATVNLMNVRCGIKKGIAFYIPAPADMESPDNANISIAGPVAELVFATVFKVFDDARKGIAGTGIDMTADQNKNKIPQTELAEKLKALKP